MNSFSWFFFTLVLASTILQLTLLARHIRHIKKHQTVVPKPFADQISLSAHKKAAAYSVAKAYLAQIALIYSTVLTLTWTLGQGIAYFINHPWLTSLNGYPLLQGIVLLSAFILANALLHFPLEVWSTFKIEATFGFNRKTVHLFLSDLLKESLLFILLGLPLIALMLWVMTHLGDYWWFFAWMLWTGLQLTLMLVYPTLIAPLFNRFEPLSDATILNKVEQLLTRCGFHFKGVFVMDGSRRSSHSNAYFTGLGRNKRVVFYDTLLKRLNADEIEAVLAHELGHFKCKHIQKRILWSFGLSLLLFYAIAYLIQQSWFFEGLQVSTQVTTINTPLIGAITLILLSLVLPALFTFITPLSNFFSRKHEFEADRFAAQHASSAALVHALMKLYEDNANSLTPDPLYSTFYDSHPPATIRVQQLLRTS